MKKLFIGFIIVMSLIMISSVTAFSVKNTFCEGRTWANCSTVQVDDPQQCYNYYYNTTDFSGHYYICVPKNIGEGCQFLPNFECSLTSCGGKTPVPNNGVCNNLTFDDTSYCYDYYGFENKNSFYHCSPNPVGGNKCVAYAVCSPTNCSGKSYTDSCSSKTTNCGSFYELDTLIDRYNVCTPTPNHDGCTSQLGAYYAQCAVPLPDNRQTGDTVPEFGTTAIIAVIAIVVIGAFLFIRKR